jgi:predicted SnoaL-like aldol condensation-catalyzing enzyme
VQPKARKLRIVRVIYEADVCRRGNLVAQHTLRCNRRRGQVEIGAVDVRRVGDTEEVRMPVYRVC